MLLSQLIKMFILDNEIKGNSEQTIKQYDRVLRYFIEFAGDINVVYANLKLGQLAHRKLGHFQYN